jgi:hypothetical protein
VKITRSKVRNLAGLEERRPRQSLQVTNLCDKIKCIYFPMRCSLHKLQFNIRSGNGKKWRDLVTSRTPAGKGCEKSSILRSLQSKIWRFPLKLNAFQCLY